MVWYDMASNIGGMDIGIMFLSIVSQSFAFFWRNPQINKIHVSLNLNTSWAWERTKEKKIKPKQSLNGSVI
jgi:hypothetical protein